MKLFPKDIFYGALIFMKNKNYKYKISIDPKEYSDVNYNIINTLNETIQIEWII
jgi:hypothetical protein